MKTLEKTVDELFDLNKLDDKDIIFITSDNQDIDNVKNIDDERLKEKLQELYDEFGSSCLCEIEELNVTKVKELKTKVKIYLDKTLKEVIDLFTKYFEDENED